MSRAGDWVAGCCVTVLGSGHAPFASGTWGSLAALALFLPLWRLAGPDAARLDGFIITGVLAASVVAVACGDWAVRRYGRKDPKPFVLDEFAGQWVALALLPGLAGASLPMLAGLLTTQFLLFRVADIIKPPPARQLEALPAGWGILCDDLCAGLYANLAGQLLWRMTPLASFFAGPI